MQIGKKKSESKEKEEEKSVGVSAEEEQARATKTLEEKILMLQTYADESVSRPVM